MLFLFRSLIYSRRLPCSFKNGSFPPVITRRRDRTRARTAETASKYIKRLSGINYRTRTFELRPGDAGRGGYRPFLLHATNYLIGRTWPWPQILPSVTFALRNLNSDAGTILIFDTRETAGQGRADLLFESAISGHLHLPTKIEKQGGLLSRVEFIVFERAMDIVPSE